MTAFGSRLPAVFWHNDVVVSLMGRMAGPVLGAGTIRLRGRVPSGQWFKLNPVYVWATTRVTATLRQERLGEPGPIAPQRRLGDFRIRNRGLFAVQRAVFEPYAPDRHLRVTPPPDRDRR
jgi:hypothetical protein